MFQGVPTFTADAANAAMRAALRIVLFVRTFVMSCLIDTLVLSLQDARPRASL